MQLKRIGPAFDRIYRMEQNSNLEKIEQANSTLESKMDALLSGKIDDAALQTDIEKKLNDLETQYAPKLTDASERLEDTEKRTMGFINVREFGVIEDNGVDYTKEMQNAIDYAIEHGLILHSNPGKVEISEPGLVIWRPITWIGAKGRSYAFNPTILSYNGNGSAITFRKKDTANGDFLPNETGQLAAPNIKGISIVRNFSQDTTATKGYGNQGYGINFYRTSEGIFEDCTVTGFKVGIHAQGLSITEFIKCDIKMNTYGVWLSTGAEDNSRAFHNPKVALRDCNFYINYEAHVLPGYYQTVVDNCHMEISKRNFYFPMNANFRIVDTFDVYSLNSNANIQPDSYYSGNFPEIVDPVFIDIVFDSNSVILMSNIKVENSRIRSSGDLAKIINLNHNSNNNSSVELVWNNNKILGCPNGLVSSTSNNYPIVNIVGLNKYKTFNDSNYSVDFNIYGSGGNVNGYEYDNNRGYMRLIGKATFNYRTVNLVPTNAITPFFIGEEVLDTANNMWYKAYGTTNDTWKPITMNYRTSGISPIGATTPRYLGEEYLNLTDKKWYKSVGLNNNDWVALN